MGSWEWRGEIVPRVRFLLLNIVELDLQHSIMWYLDAGRGVKYRIPPFGILEGLYNVLFLFDSGEKVNRLLGRLVWVSSAFQSKVYQAPWPICLLRALCDSCLQRQVPFWAWGPARLKNSINSMILQVALRRVGAGNRSAVWQTLNLTGLPVLFFLQPVSEHGLAVLLALLCEPCCGVLGSRC